MRDIGIDKFTFGCEIENYCNEWGEDHGETMESRSPIFNNFNALLIHFRNVVKRHMDDDNFRLHSHPEDKSSTISTHMHFAVKSRNWQDEYGWDIYERLYELINMFQFFFKNSPEGKHLSKRHEHSEWCDLTKYEKGSFNFGGRTNRALTPNPVGTLEFRFNDVPKSLNQLTMYYYLVYIASKKDIDIPNMADLRVNSIEDIEKSKSRMFSYKDLESVKAYKSNYKTNVFNFAEHLGNQLKGVKFFNFNNRRHCKFETFIQDCFNHDYKLFKEFKGNQKDWSDNLKSRFIKNIPIEIIKEE